MLAKMLRTFTVVVSVVAFGLGIGCAGDKKKIHVVRGKVTLDGKEVPNGTITFIPESGPAASGEIQPDGTYTLTTYKPGDGAAEGKYKVVIVAMQDQAGRLPEERNPLPPPIVPNKYSSITTTDLEANVKAGENNFDFPLEKEKK
jgi:hypothetical protein